MIQTIKKVYIVSFTILLLIPFSLTVANVKVGRVVQEKRPKAQKPVYNGDIAAYSKGYYKYFCDNYFGRDLSINIYNDIKVYCFHESPVPDRVLIGKNNYLFRVDQRKAEKILDYQGCCISCFQGYIEFNDDVLTKRCAGIIHFKEWLAKHNIQFYLMVVPDKHTVYPENLPDTIKKGNTTTADRMIQYLQHYNINIIDLRHVLVDAKALGYDLYYVTDSHWNTLGAYIGYRYIINSLSKQFNTLKPFEINLSSVSFSEYESKGDLLLLLGVEHYPHYRESIFHYPVNYTFIKNENYHKGIIITRGPANLPRAIIYRDSMFCNLLPLIANNFSHAVFMWEYLWGNNAIDMSFIESEKPDIVIIETVERYLKYFEDIVVK